MSPTYGSIPVAVQNLFDRPLFTAIGIGIAIGFFPVVCELIVMSSLPGAISGWLCLLQMILFVFSFLFALLGLVPALTLMLFRGTRRTVGLVWIACVISLLFSLPGISLSHFVRLNGFRQMAERTKPLIAAIKRFEAERKAPPAELEDLVPKYIPQIPSTGIGAYPEYRYERLMDEPDSWELRVDCGLGVLNWDEFFYRPSEKYGERPGGWVEPVGVWAYFHE